MVNTARIVVSQSVWFMVLIWYSTWYCDCYNEVHHTAMVELGHIEGPRLVWEELFLQDEVTPCL